MSKRKRLIQLIFIALVSLSYSYSSIGGTVSLHPSGVVYDGGFITSGGSWGDVLDTNDGDASFASLCCGPGGGIFYVDLDAPNGIGSNAITGVDLYVYARYLDGPWPGAVPVTGGIDVGFRTGSSTLWNGNVVTDYSNAYSIIQTRTFTTDSDGGLLDLDDIFNLQVAVKRNTYGPPQLRVTEVYADVHYTTPVPLPSAIFLFGTGLAGLVTAGVRKKKG